ncbi:MAG: aldo/keto reductase [SAR324 cluster bacterium]|nr:aldo/keto reductase [SAR324 cluster bacterium]
MNDYANSSQNYYLLSDNYKIPKLGLGTYKLLEQNAYNAVLSAIDIGYRLIDTATIYENESAIGRAIKDCSIEREELFITTKLWHTGLTSVMKDFHESLSKLSLDYIDLYLIHWPADSNYISAWGDLIKLQAQGLVRSIGVSNFTEHHLQSLFSRYQIKPVINQIEFSPFLYQKELLDFCSSHEIIVQAYTPLTRGKKLTHHVLQKIALYHHKTPAQIALRWGLELGLVELPKASSINHLQENFAIFDFSLTESDHHLLADI